MEDLVVVRVVIHNPVGVSIERAVPLTGDELDVLWRVLVRLDVVGAAVRVERSTSRHVLADGDEREEVLADDAGELFELRSTDAVGAVDGEGGEEEAAFLQAGVRRAGSEFAKEWKGKEGGGRTARVV